MYLQGFPIEFAQYLEYCRQLKFEQVPDYMYLRQLFRNLFRTLKYRMDDDFDWKALATKKA
jgi:hypothetical protein